MLRCTCNIYFETVVDGDDDDDDDGICFRLHVTVVQTP